jgi:AcrR family transcriptional regulator
MGRTYANSSKTDILDAAVRVLLRDGVMRLTLDGVAAEAGVSKGGVFYHFANKDALVGAMVTHTAQTMKAQSEKIALSDPEPVGRRMRAYFRCAFQEIPKSGSPEAGDDPEIVPTELARVMMSLMAAMAMNPQLLEPTRPLFEEMMNDIIGDSQNPDDDLLLWLAIDGFWLWQLLGLVKSNPAMQTKILRLIRNKIRPQPATDPKKKGTR